MFSISGRTTGGWNAALKANNNNNLTIVVTSPANAPIGWYTMNVEISSQGRVSSQKLGMFILLFNPWLQGRSLTTASPTPPTALIEATSVENKDDGHMLLTGLDLIVESFWTVGGAEKLTQPCDSRQLHHLILKFVPTECMSGSHRNCISFYMHVLYNMINYKR